MGLPVSCSFSLRWPLVKPCKIQSTYQWLNKSRWCTYFWHFPNVIFARVGKSLGLGESSIFLNPFINAESTLFSSRVSRNRGYRVVGLRARELENTPSVVLPPVFSLYRVCTLSSFLFITLAYIATSNLRFKYRYLNVGGVP